MTNQEPIPFNSIEDLPDGEEILLYISRDDYKGWCLAARYDMGILINGIGFTDDCETFTHWSPLPPPPLLKR